MTLTKDLAEQAYESVAHNLELTRREDYYALIKEYNCPWMALDIALGNAVNSPSYVEHMVQEAQQTWETKDLMKNPAYAYMVYVVAVSTAIQSIITYED